MGFWKKKQGLSVPTTLRQAAQPPANLKIEISQSAGVVRVRDPRIFHEERRAWCRELAESMTGCPEVRAVCLNLETAAFEIRFLAQPSAHFMAGVLAASMRAADSPTSGGSPAGRGWFTRRSSEPLAWTCLVALPGVRTASIWASRVSEPGLIEIEHACLCGSKVDRKCLVDGLRGRFQSLSLCRVNRRTRRLELRFDPGRLEPAEILEAAQSFLDGTWSSVAAADTNGLSAVSSSSSPEPTILVTGPRRLFYLALGGGALAMIFVGLAIPGGPTVTFPMLSSYYLARSSIRLHGHLVRSSFFGPVVREWGLHRGLSVTSKTKLSVLTMGVVGLSFLLVGITPVVLTVTFVLSTAGLVSLVRLPGVEEEDRPSVGSSRVLALPSPAV